MKNQIQKLNIREWAHFAYVAYFPAAEEKTSEQANRREGRDTNLL